MWLAYHRGGGKGLIVLIVYRSCYFFLFQTYSEYVYFCYYVLCAETLYQEKCGLKYALANKLHDKPEMCIETALKVREEINKNLRIK